MRFINIACAVPAAILIGALLAGCAGSASTPSPSIKQQENPVVVSPEVKAQNEPTPSQTPTPTPTPTPQVIQTLKLVNPTFDKATGTISYTLNASDVGGNAVVGRTIQVTGVYYVTSDDTQPMRELTRGPLPKDLPLGLPITVPAGFSMTGVKTPMFYVSINWGAYQDFNTVKPLAYSQDSLNQVARFRMNQPYFKGGPEIWFTIDALNTEGDIVNREIRLQSITLYVTGKLTTASETRELVRENYLKTTDTGRESVYLPAFMANGKLNGYDFNSLVIHMIMQGESV